MADGKGDNNHNDMEGKERLKYCAEARTVMYLVVSVVYQGVSG